MRDIIIKPIITEKSMKDVANSRFTFRVEKTADKIAVKQAIEKVFKVTVEEVLTSIVKGKHKRVGLRRIQVTEPSWKKATVRLTKGQKIDLFESGT